MRDLAEVLRMARVRSGMTLRAVANKLSVACRSVSRWESGEREPSIAMLRSLAKVYGLTISELLSELNNVD